MGTFTVLGVGEWGALASAFDLGAVRSARPITAGTINSNYELVSEHGHWFARVNEGKAEVDVAWEARLVEALAQRGVATPAPRIAHGWPAVRTARCTDREVGQRVSMARRPPPRSRRRHRRPRAALRRGARTASTSPGSSCRPRGVAAASTISTISPRATLASRALSDPMLAHAMTVLGEELERARFGHRHPPPRDAQA